MFSPLSFLTGRQHNLDALVLMRGETHVEVVAEGSMAMLVVASGTATISRARTGTLAGFYLRPRRGAPVWLTTPGTYCLVAKDNVVAMRLIKTGATP